MMRPGLSEDQLITLALAAVALACLVLGARWIARPGRRVAGGALLALGAVIAFLCYAWATFSIRLF